MPADKAKATLTLNRRVIRYQWTQFTGSYGEWFATSWRWLEQTVKWNRVSGKLPKHLHALSDDWMKEYRSGQKSTSDA